MTDFEFMAIVAFPDSVSIKNVNMVVDTVGEVMKRFAVVLIIKTIKCFLKRTCSTRYNKSNC
jgi:hypothetical protein